MDKETLQHNERFGATAAVTPQKRQYRFESEYPAERLVKAAAAPSRHHVSGHCGTVWRE